MSIRQKTKKNNVKKGKENSKQKKNRKMRIVLEAIWNKYEENTNHSATNLNGPVN